MWECYKHIYYFVYRLNISSENINKNICRINRFFFFPINTNDWKQTEQTLHHKQLMEWNLASFTMTEKKTHNPDTVYYSDRMTCCCGCFYTSKQCQIKIVSFILWFFVNFPLRFGARSIALKRGESLLIFKRVNKISLHPPCTPPQLQKEIKFVKKKYDWLPWNGYPAMYGVIFNTITEGVISSEKCFFNMYFF